MTIKRNKLNISIAVATGLLIGFVLGAAYGSPEGTLTSTGSTQGNVSRLSRYKNVSSNSESTIDKEVVKDTLLFTAKDSNGESWTIVMTNNE